MLKPTDVIPYVPAALGAMGATHNLITYGLPVDLGGWLALTAPIARQVLKALLRRCCVRVAGARQNSSRAQGVPRTGRCAGGRPRPASHAV